MEKLDLIAGATIALDKPLTWSSFSLVNKFRCEACRYLGIKKLKVGHAGTLDPLATGVMILCTGKHTKRIDELQAGRKEYIADIRLGQTTPTFDMETEPDAFFPTEHITREAVEEALKGFIGTIEQVPPAFSAVKVDGRRAYDLARKGRDFELKAKTLVIDEIELLDYALPQIQIRVVCSKGTYILATSARPSARVATSPTSAAPVSETTASRTATASRISKPSSVSTSPSPQKKQNPPTHSPYEIDNEGY